MMPGFISEIRDLLFRRFGPADLKISRSPLESCLVAILSPQTSSLNVDAALSALRLLYGEFTCERLSILDVGTLGQAIHPAGHAAAKAGRILRFCQFVLDEGGMDALEHSRTERLRERLFEVPGLSPETIDTILLTAFGRPVFPVSRAAYRVLVRHRLIEEEADYERVREFFENRMGEDPVVFSEVRDGIAQVGKEYCVLSDPRCEACPLKNVNGGPVFQAR